MDISADTNILIYNANDHSPFHSFTTSAVSNILVRGDSLIIFPQNLVEFWAVATRPLSSNGLGLTIDQAETEIRRFRRLFRFIVETSEIYPEWKRLVSAYRVSGKNVHDARLVAQMNVHSLTDILTFNIKDFSRYENINVVDPATV